MHRWVIRSQGRHKIFSFSHSLDLLSAVIGGGDLLPSERLSLGKKVSSFLRLWQTGQ